METIVFILGILYILSMAITYVFTLEECISNKLKWYYYLLSILVAAFWPLIGYRLAYNIHKEKSETVRFWRDKALEAIDKVRENEVKLNEIFEETEESDD